MSGEMRRVPINKYSTLMRVSLAVHMCIVVGIIIGAGGVSLSMLWTYGGIAIVGEGLVMGLIELLGDGRILRKILVACGVAVAVVAITVSSVFIVQELMTEFNATLCVCYVLHVLATATICGLEILVVKNRLMTTAGETVYTDAESSESGVVEQDTDGDE